ncbi:glycosyltransferase family 2 protein [Candidatus Pacearchaeota archaeon]|nr:glycosyltransferase family 2 protein [Candidatus Pacearchaeota archaeon]
MKILPYIYLFYMFVSLYFFFFYVILYKRNKERLYEVPKIKKRYTISVLIPAWNEEGTLRGTVESVIGSARGYPLKEIIIINDASTDGTLRLARELAGKYSIVRVLNNKRNLGKAGGLNRAIPLVRGELIAVVDSQSYLERDSIKNLIGFFEEQRVGVATAKILVRHKVKFLEKLQALEYAVIAFTRKMLGFIDCIYVTPGPLSIYRKEVLLEVGGFDTKNLTEDIEMTWRIVSRGYSVRMGLSSHVETVTPNKFKKWWRQRNRWNMGGLQCLIKYKKMMFNKENNMLGMFIVPYFALTLFLGLLGLGIFIYLTIRNMLSSILYTKYTIAAGSSLITLNDFYFTATVLNFLGIALFIASLIFTIIGLRAIKQEGVKIYSPPLMAAYLLIYLTIYPIILINSIIRLIRGDVKWW